MATALALKNVSKSFGAIHIATGLDLEVRDNEAVGILGPNGAGKTTILGLIAGTLALDAGSIAFCGREISRLPTHERCRLGIARAYQVPQPFGDMTVFENLMVAACFGARQGLVVAQSHCLEILERCGLSSLADARALLG